MPFMIKLFFVDLYLCLPSFFFATLHGCVNSAPQTNQNVNNYPLNWSRHLCTAGFSTGENLHRAAEYYRLIVDCPTYLEPTACACVMVHGECWVACWDQHPFTKWPSFFIQCTTFDVINHALLVCRWSGGPFDFFYAQLAHRLCTWTVGARHRVTTEISWLYILSVWMKILHSG